MSRTSDRARVVLGSEGGLLAVAAIWGSTFVVVKEAVEHGPPLGFIALRFGLASLVMVALFRRRAFARSAWRPGTSVGVLLFVGFATQTIGLQFTTAAKSAFVTSTYVLLVPLVIWVLERRRPARRDWGLAVTATVGLFLLVAPTTGWSTVNRGDLLTGACAVAFAMHIVMLGRAALGSHSVAALATAQIAVCACLAAVASLLFERPLSISASPTFLLAALFTGLFATALAFAIQTSGQRRVDPSRAAVLLSTEPMFAALVALAAGETWSMRGVAGAALILVATIAVALPRKPRSGASSLT